MRNDPADRRFPKVPIQRRGFAFLIDFAIAWLISLPFAAITQGLSVVQLLVFIVAWLGLRVVVPAKTQGQSLGRYALDMKVVDAKYLKTPGLFELSKREGITGFCALLVVIGLANFANFLSLVLLASLLAADCGVAFADPVQQAFHDRIGGTIVVASRRGLSLDLRLKKLLAQFTRNVK